MIRSKELLKLIEEAQKKGFSYVAQDDDKTWFAFKEKPLFSEGVWVVSGSPRPKTSDYMLIGNEYSEIHPSSSLTKISDILAENQ